MSLPQRNATLLELRAPGLEDYAGPSAGAVVFAGAVDAYVTSKRRMTGAGDGSGGGGQIVDETLLIVADGDLPAEVTVGMVAKWRPTGGAIDKTAPVARVERPEIDDPEIPQDVRTVRLALDLR